MSTVQKITLGIQAANLVLLIVILVQSWRDSKRLDRTAERLRRVREGGYTPNAPPGLLPDPPRGGSGQSRP